MDNEEAMRIAIEAQEDFGTAFAALGHALQKMRGELEKTGAAAKRSYGDISQSLGGSGERLSGMLSGMSGAFGAFNAALNLGLMPLRQVGKGIRVFISDLRGVIPLIRTAVGMLRRLGTAAVGVVTRILKLAATINVALVGALGFATKFAVDFETAMLRVGGVLGKTMAQMGRLQQAVRETAKLSTFRPGEIAGGGAFALASLGFTETEIAGMIRGVTMLAEALRADFGQAAETTGIMP
jgi:hypothetical protein